LAPTKDGAMDQRRRRQNVRTIAGMGKIMPVLA
jgi:hypothetical protein